MRKLTVILITLLIGCAGAQVYEQNCVDIASSAGHTYERMFASEAFVCVGYDDEGSYHAQAYGVFEGVQLWVTATFATDYNRRTCVPIIAVNVDPELAIIEECMPLKVFDRIYG